MNGVRDTIYFTIHRKTVASKRKERDGDEFIYTPYITVGGKRIYAKSGKVFRIPIDRLKRR